MNAITLLTSLIIAFAGLVILSKKEQHLAEDTEQVKFLLQNTNVALNRAAEFIGKDKVPHKIMNALDDAMCKLMCNVRADKQEATQFSMLYGHFKHVLDELLVEPSSSHEYPTIKKHIEEQYDHIHHELASAAKKRGFQLAQAH